LIYEVLKIRDFSKLLRLLFATPQKLLHDPLWGRDPPVGNHCLTRSNLVRLFDSLLKRSALLFSCRSKNLHYEDNTLHLFYAKDVVEAADYFQMDTLKNHCERFLMRQVAESNCLGLMQFASLHSLGECSRSWQRRVYFSWRKRGTRSVHCNICWLL